MKTKKILMIGLPILLVGGLLAAGTYGFRQHRGHMAKEFLEYRLDKMTEELELNASQKAQLDRLKEDLFAKMEDRKGKHEEIHQLLKDEFSKPNPDLSRIKPMIDGQIDEMAQLGHEFVGRIDEFYSQLTPEQKKKISDHILEHMEEHESRFEH